MVNILKWCKEIALTTYNGIGVRPQALPQQLAYKNIYTKNGKHLVINSILGGWRKGFTLRLCINEAHVSLDFYVSFADKRLKHVSQTSSMQKLTKYVFVTKTYGSLGAGFSQLSEKTRTSYARDSHLIKSS